MPAVGTDIVEETLAGTLVRVQVAVLRIARVVKWQTRTFEGRMPQGVGVQVPPRAEEKSPLTKKDQTFGRFLRDF